MKTYSIAKLKDGLSSIVADVAKGGEVLITDHNRPVARLVPVSRIAPLPKINLARLRAIKPIKLPRGAKSSTQIIRELRDAQ